jgi:amidohydrolase
MVMNDVKLSDIFTEWLNNVYRDLHMHPELGHQEFRTTQKIRTILDELHIEQLPLPGMETGAAGIIRGSEGSRTLAIRADIDALPIQETTSLPWKSQTDGVMHACGHDMNTTILLGVAKYLVESGISGTLKGNLKFIFQPAEETLGGASRMIEAGILKNPDVDRIVMSHGDADITLGEIALFKDFSHASSDHFFIDFHGKGGHGSRPYQTQDLILAGAYLVNLFQSVVSRDLDARDVAVLSVCTFNAGAASNVIPADARLSGTVRTFRPEVQERVRERMAEITSAMGTLFHMEAKLDYQVGVPSCIIDADTEQMLYNAALKTLGSEKKIFFSKTRTGGEDFAFYSKLVPAGVMRIGVTPVGTEKKGSTHSSTFQIDERALPVGVQIFVEAVRDYLL